MTPAALVAFREVVIEHDDHRASINLTGVHLHLPTPFAAMHYADVLSWHGEQVRLGDVPVTLTYDRGYGAVPQQREATS